MQEGSLRTRPAAGSRRAAGGRAQVGRRADERHWGQAMRAHDRGRNRTSSGAAHGPRATATTAATRVEAIANAAPAAPSSAASATASAPAARAAIERRHGQRICVCILVFFGFPRF